VTRRKSSSPTFSMKASCTRRGRSHILVGSPSSTKASHTRRTRNDTFVGVISCSASFPRPTTHAEHETAPSLVPFCVRRLSYTLLHCRARNYTNEGVISCSASFPLPYYMPSMKQHPHWCFFVLGVFSSPYDTFQPRNDTNKGVVSCSDPFLPLERASRGFIKYFLYYYII
jgi:hypothetical protein